MSENALHQFFVLYAWFGFAALVLFLALIARFYQRFEQFNTYYTFYGLAIVLLGASAIRRAGIPPVQQDFFANLFLAAGSLCMLCLTWRLSRHMLAKK